MDSKTEIILAVLSRYAKGRRTDSDMGLESPELSALLLEKYAVGMVDVIRALGLDIDVNDIASEADYLCHQIDPNVADNRKLRYQRVAKLDLTEERKCTTVIKI